MRIHATSFVFKCNGWLDVYNGVYKTWHFTCSQYSEYGTYIILVKNIGNLRNGFYGTLKKTIDISLLFKQDDSLGQNVIGYVNSNCAGDIDKQRSTTGYIFTLAGGLVSQKCTLQSIVTLSTIEPECMAIIEAITEVIWSQSLLENLGLLQSI